MAPIGVEFGLLYAAFRRRLARDLKQTIPWSLWALEVLLFLTAMLVNGTDAFSSVVESTHMDKLSFAAISEQFGELPANSQSALIMAGLAAFIIPIGTLVIGKGLAAIVLDRRLGVDVQELRWREVELSLLYRAVFVRYMQNGLSDRDAKQRAMAEVKGYLSRGVSSGVQALPVGSAQSAQAHSVQLNGIKAKVYAYLAENPHAKQMSITDVQAALSAQGVRAGHTTVAEVLAKSRKAKGL